MAETAAALRGLSCVGKLEDSGGRLGTEWDRMSLCSTQCPKAIKAKRNGKPLCIADVVVVVVGISMKLRPMSNGDVGDEAKNE